MGYNENNSYTIFPYHLCISSIATTLLTYTYSFFEPSKQYSFIRSHLISLSSSNSVMQKITLDKILYIEEVFYIWMDLEEQNICKERKKRINANIRLLKKQWNMFTSILFKIEVFFH